MSTGFNLLALAVVAVVLLVVVLLLIYLVGRLNQVEQQTKEAVTQWQGQQAAAQIGPFGGLSGKPLWDAMSGKAPPEVSALHIEAARDNYPAVLQRHIVLAFEEGTTDAKKGVAGKPKNPRTIHTVRGKVDSWLPSAQLQAIYPCGADQAQGQSPNDASLQQTLELACHELHERTGVPADTDYLHMLLAPTPESTPPAPAAPPPAGG
jgi:hypothetical protein